MSDPVLTEAELVEGYGSGSGLAAALAAFQAEDGLTFPKTKTAKVKSQRTGGEYSYKYADLGDILPVVRPLLAKHGLSWSSKPGYNDAGDLVLAFRLLHASGEEDAGEMPLGVERGCKPQELGSAITYARRYALTAQLNLATEEDDDGQVAQNAGRSMARASGNGSSAQPTAAPAQQTERPASAKQRGMLNARAADAELSPTDFANVILIASGQDVREFDSQDAAEQWLKRALDRLPAKLVDPALKQIERIKEGASA